MHGSNWILGLMAIVSLLLIGCQSISRSPQVAAMCGQAIPTRAVDLQSHNVPQVVRTVKVKILGGDGTIVVNECTGDVYVAGSRDITIFKESELVGEVATKAKKISHMAVDETANLLYAVDTDGDSVIILRGSEIIGTVPTVGRGPEGVTLEPHSQYAYVVSAFQSRPFVGDAVGSDILVLKGTQVIDDLKVSGRLLLRQIVADPIGGYIYAGDVGGVILVLKGLQEVGRYQLSEHDLVAMDADPSTGEVYVLSDRTLHRFKDGRLIDRIMLSDTAHWSKVAVHPATGDVYVTHGGQGHNGGRVFVIRDMKEIADVVAGGGPAHITTDSVTGNVYVAGFDEDTVTVINGTKALATIKVGWYPYAIGVNPTDGWVYVTNTVDGTVSILGFPPFPSTRTPPPIPTPANAPYPQPNLPPPQAYPYP